jgi:hypothetical protein
VEKVMSQRSAGACTRCTRANAFPEMAVEFLNNPDQKKGTRMPQNTVNKIFFSISECQSSYSNLFLWTFFATLSNIFHKYINVDYSINVLSPISLNKVIPIVKFSYERYKIFCLYNIQKKSKEIVLFETEWKQAYYSALFHFNKTEKSFSPICWAIFRNITEFSQKLFP